MAWTEGGGRYCPAVEMMTPLENARWAVENDAVRANLESVEAQRGRLFMKALRLSGGKLAVGEALLRGEHVPVAALDQRWAREYGLL